MSFQITTSFVQQYSSNLAILSQQKGSRLRNAVRTESITGEAAFFDQIGATVAQKKTTRHGDSPIISTPHSRRKVVPEDYEWGDMIDKLDKVKTLIDPANGYVQAGSFALGRSIDEALISASTGTAYTGKTGSDAVVLPDAQKVAVTLGAASGFTNAGLTIEKLRATKQILDESETDPEEERYFSVSAQQVNDLLGTTEVTSSDYASVKALVQGDVDTFMGFKFLRTELLDLNATTDIRTCFAWCKSGILLALNEDIVARVSERADKSFSWYAYACMAIGATRMEEVKVVEIPCDESPA